MAATAAMGVSLASTPFLSHHRKTPLLSCINHSLFYYRIPHLQKPRPLSLRRSFVPLLPPPAASTVGFSSSAKSTPFLLLWAPVSLAFAAAANSIRASGFGLKFDVQEPEVKRNMVPLPFIVLYQNKLATFLAGKSGGTATRLLDMLFIRTGAIIAPFCSSVSANFFGAVITGLSINLLVNLALKYSVATGIILFLVSVLTRSTRAKQESYAPLVSALKSAGEDNAASFHFPGHNRGEAAPSPLTDLIGKTPYAYDLPELPELDNLFSPRGPILDAQKRASHVFGASETWFLTGGTTCGVQASIMATCSPGDTLILPRNCHISAISGMVLSGAIPKYIVPEYQFDWEIAGPVTPSQVNQAIKELEESGRKPGAVLVTSPTYHGVCSNIRKISELCNSKDIPLIVDEAHGGHFGFHPELPSSALNQGADLAIQSTHKVLCSLTQSSMLHSSGGRLVERERINRCLQTLQSSSPSYLLLASLDAATAQLAINPEHVFKNAIHLAEEAKALIKRIPGLSVLEPRSFSELPVIEPLRLTIGVYELGLSGYEADEILVRDQGVMCELVGSRSITFVFTPGTREDHVQRLVLGFKNLSTSIISARHHHHSTTKAMEIEPLSKMEMTPREAFFARKRKASLEESIGQICGELVCPYPPGIPLLVPGEVITRKALEYAVDVNRQGGVVTGASDPLLSSILVICQ